MANDIDVNLKFSDGDILAKLQQIEKEFGELNKEVSKTGKALDTDFNAQTKNFSTSVGDLTTSLGALGGALGGISVGALALEAVKAADAFNLMQASLKRVSGGDAEIATAKFRELSKIADELGIKNKDLAETYIQLANRGFKPTSDQIKALVDISTVSRKTVTQLSEAILDAQTLEFERLKEFGIRQKDLGDKVSFTYGGITKTADKTAESIAKTILEFGNLASIQLLLTASSTGLPERLPTCEAAMACTVLR